MASQPLSGSTDDLLRRLRADLAGRDGDPAAILVHEERLPARPPTGEVLRPPLPRPLGAALRARSFQQLYSHQVRAIQAARAGRDFVVRTPTASGKTLCFNLPVIERALREPEARALYLYPTKALAADQLRGLEDLLADVHGESKIRAARLDGDVPADERERLRADPPNVLLANPDIVHYDVLLRNRRWQRLLSNLRFVVLDELHAYRGVFGAHVGLILRRLLRLAERAGARPTIIAASATIANPDELAERLTGRPFAVIDGDGAGSHARRFVLWRPPLRGSAADNEHRSALQESVALFVELLQSGRTVILFGQSRVAVERMLATARRALGSGLADRISGYKSGYTPEERARVEEDLRAGRLRGVIATNALELGIDIGSLDAAVLAGYPGSVMSTWQQAGRVGRRGGDEALVFLVGADDALDQYYLNHPRAFFGQSAEQAVVDPGNESILLGHLLCAAQEAPLREEELRRFPESARRSVDRLVKEGLLTSRAPWRLPEGSELPHRLVSIRGVRRDQYRVVEGARTIAQIEPPHLYREAHPGAVYLHQGTPYRVLGIDEAARQVRVRSEPVEARTDPVAEVVVAPRGEPLHARMVRLGSATVDVKIGPVAVRESIAEFREKVPGVRGATVRRIPEPCEYSLETVGLWLDFPDELRATFEALHATEHALANALPIALLCDRRDVGSSCDATASSGGRVYLFDAYEGGIGLSEKAYETIDALVESAAELLRGCRCAEGCPSCLHLPGCPSGNDDLDKSGALSLLSGKALTPAGTAPRPRARDAANQEGAGMVSRLRKLAEEGLRERLAELRSVRVGDPVEYVGYGPVVVLEIAGERARVRFRGSAASMWVPVEQLRKP